MHCSWSPGKARAERTGVQMPTAMKVAPHYFRRGEKSSPSIYSAARSLSRYPAAIVISWTLIMACAVTRTAHAFTTGGEHPCTYDFELQTSTMKISCPGSPSTVNVYADTASLQAQDLTDARNFPLGTPGGGRGRGRESQQNYRGHQHRSGTGDPYYPFVWNASKRLDEARRSLTGYSSSLESVSVKLAEGKINLDSDMDKLRRDTDTADQLKQHIVAAMTNQFNFMRSLIVNRNQDLQNLVDSLNLLVEVTSEGLHKARDSHRMTLDRVDYLNDTLVSVRKMLNSELRKKDKRRRRANKEGKKAKPKGEAG